MRLIFEPIYDVACFNKPFVKRYQSSLPVKLTDLTANNIILRTTFCKRCSGANNEYLNLFIFQYSYLLKKEGKKNSKIFWSGNMWILSYGRHLSLNQ